jgi:DNA-binding NarL/FixJ family response regulator
MPEREINSTAGSDSSSAPACPKRPRLYLLADVRLYRDGLVYILERGGAFDVLGASDLSDQCVAQVAAHNPDGLVLDMGNSSGLDVAKRLISILPNLKIIAFGVRETERLVLACAEAGIAGYVTADSTEQDLTNAVMRALRGELSCSPRIAGLLFKTVGVLSAIPTTQIGRESLTNRENQILNLLCEGKSNKEIGRALRISNATVKNHVHNILEKLDVRRRGEAAARLRALRSTERETPRAQALSTVE